MKNNGRTNGSVQAGDFPVGEVEPALVPLASRATQLAVPQGDSTKTLQTSFTGLRDHVTKARDALLAAQVEDGHWIYEFEADCTVTAEYVLMMHFLDEIDGELQAKIAHYIRARQADHGGWPLYLGGKLDISCTVKAYWALKLAGDAVDEPHMARARTAILERGGAARSNGFTRSLLARFAQVPWRAVAFTPVELILLPRWFPFHYSKISYWSRAVLVPLTILHSLRARAKNPTGIGVQELFKTPPEEECHYFPVRSELNRLFLMMQKVAPWVGPLVPKFIRRRAMRQAEEWFVKRLNGVDGLGGVFPSMVNAIEAMDVLGYAKDHPLRVTAKEALRRLLVIDEKSAYCQPCVSPIWDTALAGLALQETHSAIPDADLAEALDRTGRWLVERQQLEGDADWRHSRPDLAPGGWPFQYANDYYPDIDDSSAVIWVLELIDANQFAFPIKRGTDWVAGMQSSNGGFAAFDVDNNTDFLLEMPFGDSGPLLDPPTADVSGRCVTVFSILNRAEDKPATDRCIDYLLREQEENGSWFGRWGTNYIYGTWSVLMAFERIQDDGRIARACKQAATWLKSVQREDGSWGESNDSYETSELAGRGQAGTAYQTAWALLGLMAAGEFEAVEVQRGISYLQRTQLDSGLWEDPWFSAPGFPRVFYIRYVGYSAYFPLWALARYYRYTTESSLA